MENKNIIYLVKLLIKQTKLKIMYKDNNNNNKCKQNKNLNY